MTPKILIAAIPILVVTGFAGAEQIPDYYKPYAPIYLDKDTYTWTDKIRITIVAPSWDENEYGIDSIGEDPDYAVKISTSSHSLKPYELRETAPSSGTFTGEVTLTGFSHDVDGDGDPDTVPRTTGGGPTNGFLEADRNDGITISFEFADGVVLTKSAAISWNIGRIAFSSPSYLAEDQVLVMVNDPDMNLNPEALDDVEIDVYSASDTAGISVIATETDDESGTFEAQITLTQSSESSGNRLRAVPGDTIVARYNDRTLPEPHSTSDDLEVTASAIIGSNIPSTQRISIDEIYFADGTGKRLGSIRTGQQVQIATHIQNNQQYPQDFTSIIQIMDKKGAVTSLSWISGRLAEEQIFELSQSWTPKQSGQYTIESFVWKSLDDTTPLSENKRQTISIE
ncbi:MAG: hypothetical protein WAO91_01890 [Candidatus Nitrosotenuis sp.]